MSSDSITPFSTAVQMRSALRRGDISARELLDLHLRRIDRLDGRINSIIFRRDEASRREATAADDARARGEDRPLLGVPITVKESIDLVDTPSSAGVTARAGHRAATDARTVRQLKAAGAIIIGKTNVCPFLADFVADNPIYGRTLSPWNSSVTPGGSSGGSASVAAGLTAFDLGSDLGGSIRIPAAFCGLFGHKPSEGAVPYSGHFPGSSGVNPAWVMTAQGPIARSALDLDLALDVLLGPDVGLDTAWRIALPPARHQRLIDFRVAMLPWQDWLPVDAETVAAMERLAEKLRGAGVSVTVVSPPGLGDLKAFYIACRCMMSALVSARWPAEHRRQVVEDRRLRDDVSHQADVRGFTASAGDFLLWHEQRENYRQGFRDFFESYDVLLTPMSLVPPFPHPTQPVADRVFDIGGRAVGFDYLTFYPGVASLPGHGATAFPLGVNSAALPLGAQAIGPFFEDRTPIQFAALVERAFGGFENPPGWDAGWG